MIAFSKVRRIVPALSRLLLISGLAAVLTTVAAPYLGFGVGEDFLFYRLAEWSRSDLFRTGIFLSLLGLVLVLSDLMRLTNTWSWTEDRCGQIRAYFAFPPAEPLFTFSHRHQKIILGAAVLFQGFFLLIIPLGFECDAAMYLNFSRYLFGGEGGSFNYYRAPGFPIFLGLSGQLLFGSFVPTVAAHAVMGILSPLIFYRTLAPVSRTAAFIAACVFIISTTPFFAAKIMLVEQLFAFLVIACLYGFSRYYFSRDVRFLHLSLFCIFAATFTRWEASPLLFMSLIVLFFITRGRKRHLRHFVLAVSLIAILAGGWSAMRSYTLAGNMSLLGSFHNWAGRQSFWMIYWGDRYKLEVWEAALGWDQAENNTLARRVFGTKDIGSPPELFFSDRRAFVRPENGPHTQELRDLIWDIFSENPESYRALEPLMNQAHPHPDPSFQGFYQEYFGKLDGNPQAFVDNYFIAPNGFYTDYVPEELRKRLGLAGMNKLLGSVVIETISAYPTLAALLAVQSVSNISSLFGINLKILAKTTPSQQLGAGLPVLAFWGKNYSSYVPYNMAGCANAHLPPGMQQELIHDHKTTVELNRLLFPVANFLRNSVRNIFGPMALALLCFLPWGPQRKFSLFMFAMVIVYLIFGCSLGYHVYARYELAVQPLILMLAALGAMGLMNVIRKLPKIESSRQTN